MLLAIDSETTGLDLYHGAMPYFVTLCDEEGNQTYYEWPVDPLTRTPQVPEEDIDELAETLSPNESGGFIGQNLKFDVTALGTLRQEFRDYWRWADTNDTLIAAHILASNRPHDLTSLAVQYLHHNIEPYEQRLEQACKEARRLVQQERLRLERWQQLSEETRTKKLREGERKGIRVIPDEYLASWAIAEDGRPDMPSAKGEAWKYDGWLPRALARYLEQPKDHPWWTVLSEYANVDSGILHPLWQAMHKELRRRKLWDLYRVQMQLPEITISMEARGVTVNGLALEQLKEEYRDEAECASQRCVNIAASLGYELDLPKGAVNNNLKEFCFDVLGLPGIPSAKGKTGAPSLGDPVLAFYEQTLPPNSKAGAFVSNLRAKNKRGTYVSYMESYERFWQALVRDHKVVPHWYVLHPSLNQTGTDTLRWSSKSPNEQNIGKKELDGYTLRHCFGPAPGREWWSLDASNIELRIPAYEAGEQEFIALFERPNDPPYYGSNHLLIAHLLFPKEFEDCLRRGVKFNDREADGGYKSTLYQRVKNGNFAVQYGAVDRADGLGTADRTYGLPGAQARIKSRFAKLAALNQWCIDFADKHGYIETIPDRTVDPKRGYPLLCARTDYGRVKPTVPLNYRVQGTACYWMRKAMIRCHAQLQQWRDQGFDGWMVMQVHDELVFDFPKVGNPADDKGKVWTAKQTSNLWRVLELKRLMEQGGKDIGIPTPVNVEYHTESWAVGIKY